jgi:glycosyltransferase involved in cell wall biosynthesis
MEYHDPVPTYQLQDLSPPSEESGLNPSADEDSGAGSSRQTSALCGDESGSLDGLSDLPLKFGVNIAGYITGEFGVGEGVRALIRAVQAAGLPYVLNNLEVSWHRNQDTSFEGFADDNPYRVNLVAANADQADEFHEQKGASYFQGRYNIGSWFWELSRFPESWLSRFRHYDEIWVASQFIAESLSRVSPVPVVKMTYPIHIDESRIEPKRSKFGLSDGSFVFLCMFDFLSVLQRKNPWALIRAFERAFGPNDDALLVLKSINSPHDPAGMETLEREAMGLRVKFIDGHLPSDEVASLMAAADCYVSLHRSEGLGLGMAQSMYLGKPVIATGYSGNLDFMTVNNSLLVRYDLVELERDYGPYERGCLWAEPDIDHAAELMRAVFEDSDLRSRLGQRASSDIRYLMSPAAAARDVGARLLRVGGNQTDP